MSTVRALVLTGFGINCEEETAAAFRMAGAEATIAHLNELFVGRVQLDDFDVLAFPGGFSFGDDLGSGKVLANKCRFKRIATGQPFFEAIEAFLARGRFVIGICNGFQALVKLGLLPNVGGRFEQEATLTRNDSGRFEDRWVELVANPKSRTPVLGGVGRIRVPVRHGEGKLILRDEAIRRAVIEGGLDCLAYCDEDGRRADCYPLNPNGAELACAGLTDPTGQVFGMMPHPEAVLSFYNDPAWPQLKRSGKVPDGDEGQGVRMFRNIVNHLS